jgi:hypothetical protein
MKHVGRLPLIVLGAALGFLGFCCSASAEVITAFFNQPDGGVTSGEYDGQVLVMVSGVGQAAGPYYNDAFYVYTNGTPYHDPLYYQLSYGTSPLVPYNPVQDAVNDLPDGVPAYDPNHAYTFVLDTGVSVPTILHFGVSDGIFFDNTGDYTITISQIPIPEPLSVSLFGTGLIGLSAIRRRSRQVRSVRSAPTPA